MNPSNIPSPYKNFLPSKRFVKTLGVLAVIAIAAFLILKAIAWFRARHSANSSATAIVATIPTGDPTVRDSSGDGIPDWEEIAVGLNPLVPDTVPGVPNAVEFEKIKNAMGAENFDSEIADATDSEKVGLLMYNDMSQDAEAAGSTSTDAVSAVTGTEVANYVQAQQAKNKTYAESDLTISDDSAASINAYYSAISKLGNSPFDQDFITHLTNYIQDKETLNTYLAPKLANIDQMVTAMLAMPVPPTAESIHLSALNALYGAAQTIENYDPTTNDSLSQLGTVALAEDYIRTLTTSVASLSEYFSVAIDPNSAQK